MKRILLAICTMISAVCAAGCAFLGRLIGAAPYDLSKKQIAEYEEIIVRQHPALTYSFYYMEIYSQAFTNEEKEIRIRADEGGTEILIMGATEITYYHAGEERVYNQQTRQERASQKKVSEYDFWKYQEECIAFIRAFDGTATKKSGGRGPYYENDMKWVEIIYTYEQPDFSLAADVALAFYIREDEKALDSVYFAAYRDGESQEGKNLLFSASFVKSQEEMDGYYLAEDYEWHKTSEE